MPRGSGRDLDGVHWFIDVMNKFEDHRCEQELVLKRLFPEFIRRS